jgi:zinc transport system substrate-binding protein
VVPLEPLATPDEGHEDAGLDPHVWLDPTHVARIATAMAQRLAARDAAHAADYRANARRLADELDTLDAEFRSGLASCARTDFITTHAAFGYLAETYGLTEEAINGLDPESEPSANRVKALEKMAKADGVTTVFYETLVSDKTAKTIAADASLKTDVLDPIEGITDKSRGSDYLQVMESNLKALQKALGTK